MSTIESRADSHLERIAVIGNYPPRRCGIATFTRDLCEAVAARAPDMACIAVPVNDRPEGYAYPPRVRFEIAQNDLGSYRLAADFLNMNNVGLVSLQHEYGIFGGPAGSHILALLQELRMPLVTTLHTVLQEPSPVQRTVLKKIVTLSDRIAVMSERGVDFLRKIYDAPADKIDLIPHGVPDVAFIDPNFYKDKFGVEGRLVLLTFGLIAPSKGIEHVIEALPRVVREHPNLVYIVLGATHPHVKEREGESYRLFLERLAEERGVAGHVVFHNRFVDDGELVEFLGAADLYVTPYLSPTQIVSGTLAYAVGMGKAVVSTPYWYAEELLAEGRGVLVPFADPKAIGDALLGLLDDGATRHGMRKQGWLLGRSMIWSAVADRYIDSFERARRGLERKPGAFTIKTLDARPIGLPTLDLRHLRRMTDGVGILQHATFLAPNYAEGYTTDDNARALLWTTLMETTGGSDAAASDHATRYLAFLHFAFNPARGRFRNFLGFNRTWLEEVGSDDAHGRAIWALGMVVARSRNGALVGGASQLLERALHGILETTSLRAWSFAALGIREYLRRYGGDRAARKILGELGRRLDTHYVGASGPGWFWFENVLTYCNAAMPQALLACAEALDEPTMRDHALEALGWLCETQRSAEGRFAPIGSDGFYPKGGVRARFSQQPVEAQATVSACLEAWLATRDEGWREEARDVFLWYLGRNDLGAALYDPVTGSCRDGLFSDHVNENRGAESLLAFLQSLLEMRVMEEEPDVASVLHSS